MPVPVTLVVVRNAPSNPLTWMSRRSAFFMLLRTIAALAGAGDILDRQAVDWFVG